MPSSRVIRKADPKRARKSHDLARKSQRAAKYAAQGRTVASKP